MKPDPPVTSTIPIRALSPSHGLVAVLSVAGYEQSIRNAAQVTLASDNVFSDGSSLELATMSGGVSGYTATLTVAI